MWLIVTSILEGMFGALIFFSFRSWKSDFGGDNTNKKRKRLVCRLIMGAGIGYLWVVGGFPNSFNIVMAGMLAPEMLEGALEKFNEEYEKELKGGVLDA